MKRGANVNEYLISKIKEGRINKGLKQSDVTKFTGIKNTTLSNYENGITEPDIDTFLQLCELYELDYAGILAEAYGLSVQGENFKIRPSEIEVAKKYRFISTHSPSGANVVDIILDREYSIAKELKEQFEQIQKKNINISAKSASTRIISYFHHIASAGNGEYLFDDMPTDLIKVKDTPISRRADFVIGVNGDSMEPDYHDGEKVFVEKTPDIEVGEIGVFTRGGECFIKKCGEKVLISLNPKCPDVEPFDDGVRVVGRVIGKAVEIV